MRTYRLLPAALIASALAVPVAMAQQGSTSTPAPATGTSQDSRPPPIGANSPAAGTSATTGTATPGTAAPGATTGATTSGATPSTGSAAAVRGDTRYLELDGMDVTNASGEKIGEVSEVLIDRSGQVVALAVEAGGFLGLGDRDVVVQFDQVKLQGDRLVTSLTKEQLKDMPEWKD